ncbi:MAG TPA: hypothetical protein VN458_08105 [Solirubrobacterales bacterium]|nr:hypothetical protein [Solirubrobacterales bacterium]
MTPRPVRHGVVLALLVSLVFSAAAMAAAGDPDPTFSGDGKQTTNFCQCGFSTAEAAVRQADGKIVAVGQFIGVYGDFLVARYNLDGTLDPSFSGDGSVQTDFNGADGATDVALQGNKIVVVGFSADSTGGFALARYNPDGSLDPTFSGDGKQTTVFGAFAEGGAVGVAVQGGKIVVVGTTDPSSGAGDFALARYNLNGSLDTSFSGDGKKTTDFAGAGDDRAGGVALQGDGKIVAVGGGGGDFELARYNTDGSLDTSFSGDGLQTTDFGGAYDSASAVALQGDGKIVAVGGHDSGGNRDFALVRYNLNGSLDTSFSGDGKQTTSFPYAAGEMATDVAIQADGRIVAVGQVGGGAGPGDFGLARYNTNGSLDTSFSADGRKRTSFGGSDGFDGALGMALQGDGRIVAVGFGRDTFALARYLGG